MEFKQVNLGSWLGAAKIVIAQAGQYISYLTLVVASIAAYPTVSAWALTHNMVLQFWQFLLVGVVIVMGICVAEYMLGQAPLYVFWWEQSFKHVQQVKDADARLKRVEQNQKKIMRKLGIKGND